VFTATKKLKEKLMKNLFVLSLCFAFVFSVSGCVTDGGSNADGSTMSTTEMAAATVGGMAADSTALSILMGKLNSDNAAIRLGAIKGIAQMGGAAAQAVPGLTPLLSSSDANTRANAAFALGQIGPKANAAIPDLVRLIQDNDSKVQRNAVEAVANIGGANVPGLLVPLLISVDPSVQSSAMELLGKFGPASKAAIPTLISLAKGNKNMRDMAFDTLVKIGPDSVTAITALLTMSDTDLVTKASSALSLLKK
jgi:HEAT repeat protein